MTVAELLDAATHAHTEYREACPRMASTGSGLVRLPGDPVAAREALARAYAFRIAAEHADVAGDAIAWVDQPPTYPHYDVLKFYDVEVLKQPAAFADVMTTELQTVSELPHTTGT